MTAAPSGNLWSATCRETVDAPPLAGAATADLAVIGGGFTGCSAALHAANAGADVRLIEARQIGFGGSGRNVGLANAGLWLSPEDIRARLGDEAGSRLIETLSGAPARVFALIGEHGIDCEPVQNGTLHCAHSRAALATLERNCRQLRAIGAPVRLLDCEETALRAGTHIYAGSLFDPRAGTIQPLAYARGLARAAVAAGAHLHQQSPAVSVGHRDGAWTVRTADGEVRAGALLVATNAYHREIAGMNAPPLVHMPYFQLATAPLDDAARAAVLPGGEGCWDTAMVMSSFRVDRAGRLILGGIGSLDHAGGNVHVGWARRQFKRLFPGLPAPVFEHQWCGTIAMSADKTPQILRFGPNGYAIFGFSGRGIGPGTLFGASAADAMLSGDESRFVVPPIARYHDRMTGLRSLALRHGATLVHGFKARL
ncbi:MAG: FAD-binding oxidoreductase [Rhizobiaceae bacterium]